MRAGILIIVLVAVAVAAGLALFGRDGPAGADATDEALVALGQGVYGEYCAACHGADLKGEADWRRRRPDGTLPPPPHRVSRAACQVSKARSPTTIYGPSSPSSKAAGRPPSASARPASTIRLGNPPLLHRHGLMENGGKW